MSLSIEDLARIKVEEAIQEGLKQSTYHRLLSERNDQNLQTEGRKSFRINTPFLQTTSRLLLVFRQMLKSIGLL